MFCLTRNAYHLTKKPLQCTCYSTVRKTSSKEPPDTPKNELEEVKVKKSEEKESEKPYDPKNVTKKDMEWRTRWHQREASYFSGLRSFYSEENQAAVMKMLQTPIDLRPSAIKKWWTNRKEFKDMMLQQYLPERNQTLGNELAAAHFVVHRGGAVKFYHEDKWIKANAYNEYKLPIRFQDDKILEAIDCSEMNLYYEGLANFKDLQRVQWLSFNGVKNFDDWFLDRISNIFSHSLIYLDIRNCRNFTERGLAALYKMENLKILCIDDMLMTNSFEMTCLMLQECNPYLDFKIGD